MPVVRTYTVVNPVADLVGLLERSFAVTSWPISEFGGVVPPLEHPTVDAARVQHEINIITFRASIGLDPNGDPTNTGYPGVVTLPI